MLVIQAYRYALDPTPAQARALAAHAGAQRVAHNWALAMVKAQIDQREAEKSYGIPDDRLTTYVPWDSINLLKAWNRAKHEVAPWWRQCSKEAYAGGIRNLAYALDVWKKSKRGVRKGPPMRFPRFKSKRRDAPSCQFSTGPRRIEKDRRHVTLPVLGTIRLHESGRKLARRIEAGTARILRATVKYESRRWFVSFTC